MHFSHPRRRDALHLLATLAGAAAAGQAWAQKPAAPQPATAVEVWKDPSCGCCHDWITHMEGAGFKLTVHDTGNTAVRARLGLPAQLGSCHTALVGGYLLEGHVHADEVRRLLRDKPVALGLAVPGMPVGSPGMDGAIYGGRRDRYDTLLVRRDGSSAVFQRHG